MNLRRVLAAAALLVVLPAAPAAAIETTTFGIGSVGDDGLHVPLRPGERSVAEVRIWNRRATPLDLELSVVPATVLADGSVQLAGDLAPLEWVDLEAPRVRLAPRERRPVRLEIHAPDRLPSESATVAVLAHPEGPTGAVLQRLAVVAHLERAAPDRSGLGLWPWVAAAGILTTLAGGVSRIGWSAGSRKRR